jgi:hypothetical protein
MADFVLYNIKNAISCIISNLSGSNNSVRGYLNNIKVMYASPRKDRIAVNECEIRLR